MFAVEKVGIVIDTQSTVGIGPGLKSRIILMELLIIKECCLRQAPPSSIGFLDAIVFPIGTAVCQHQVGVHHLFVFVLVIIRNLRFGLHSQCYTKEQSETCPADLNFTVEVCRIRVAQR